MRRVRVGKGSWMRPSRVPRKVEEERLAKVLPAKRTAGRWIQDRETGRLVEESVWIAMHSNEPKGRSAYVWRDVPDYQSPVDGRLVSGRRQRRYDLQRTNSRPWEGLEQEQKAADRHRAYQDQEYDRSLEHCLRETENELKWKATKAEDHIQSQWLLGED